MEAPINYTAMEADIIRRLNEKEESTFGDNYPTDIKDPRIFEMIKFTAEIIKDFPCDARNRRFLNCKVTLIPVVVVPLERLELLHDQDPLLPSQKGKKISLAAFASPETGLLIEENDLELTDIKLSTVDKTSILAHLKFGEIEYNADMFTDGNVVEIPLPVITSKINYDGSLHFSNGLQVMVDDFKPLKEAVTLESNTNHINGDHTLYLVIK